MKKRILLIIFIIIIIVSIPIKHQNDNGYEYRAILYKVKIEESTNNKTTTINIFNKEIYKKTKSKKNENIIQNLDEFYQNELVKEYQDLRIIKKDYSEKEAINDNCFVIGEEVYNDNLFSTFFDNYENKKSSFIRVIQYTIEQDMLIYDILFDENSEKLYLVQDNSRDHNVNDEISLLCFDKMAKYEYLNHTYWVLYNNELNNDTLFGDDTFIVSYV